MKQNNKTENTMKKKSKKIHNNIQNTGKTKTNREEHKKQITQIQTQTKQ